MDEADKIIKAKKEIDAERVKIKAIIQNLNEGVVAFGVNGDVILVNPIITKLTGLPEKGFSIDEFIKLFKGVDVEAKIKLALVKCQKTHIEEVSLIGRFFYEMLFTPIIDPQDNIIGSAIILYDITHMKEVDKMKTEFVSVASHQLRTPLTAIKLFTEMLINNEAGELAPKQQEYVQDIHESTEQMVKLVNDLLNVSRLESGRLKFEPKLAQLEKIIAKIIVEFDSLAKAKGGEITFTKPKKILPMLPLDVSLTRQAITNLISNALKYASPGHVRVEARLSTTATAETAVLLARELRVVPANVPPSLVLSVTDNGIGISKDAQKRIFEKFFRADNAIKIATEGTGLGLYIAKMITEASGGHLWFKSTEGKGTTFYLMLPLAGMPVRQGEKGLAWG